MCGISGVYSFGNSNVSKEDVQQLTQKLIHRGPDYGNIFLHNNLGIGHRRLSIIDVSSKANQPMSTKDNRYHIVFNGEIYNFLELKEKLITKGCTFLTESDTEVLLEGYALEGVDFIKKLNGMFAFAIYDKKNNEIILVRDRFGIKPMYFFNDNNRFVFSSEIEPIKKVVNKKLNINKQALSEYMWFGNPLGDNTIYKEIKEVSPATIMKVSANKIELKKYYNLIQPTKQNINESEIIKEIKLKLDNAVRRQLIGEYPINIFLSGGIDSSTITAIASKYYSQKINTYSVKFDFDKGENELPLARQVAKKFNTNHHEVEINGQDLIPVIEQLVKAHGEPFADAANIPLFLLTKNLSSEIKVVLQGDGGDEVFGGYRRYNTVSNIAIWRRCRFILPILNSINTNNKKLLRAKRFLNAILSKDDAKRNALLLTMEDANSNPYRILNSRLNKDLNSLQAFKRYYDVYKNYDKKDLVQNLFYTDMQVILKDTFLEKVDKSTMQNGVEVRVPFLDNDLVDYMISIPAHCKMKNGEQKYLLKKTMEGTVPNEILYGKKHGFGVPYGFWLTKDLKDYFLAQINTESSKRFFNQEEVVKLFNNHIKNKGNNGFILWKTLILAIWINQNEIQ